VRPPQKVVVSRQLQLDEMPDDAVIRHTCGWTLTVRDAYEQGAQDLDKPFCQSCAEERVGRLGGYSSGFGGWHVVEQPSRPSALERTGGRPYVPVACALLRGEGVELDPVERLAALALAGFQGDQDDCWPTLSQLVAAVAGGFRQATISAALGRLAKDQLVLRWREHGRYHYDVRPLLRAREALRDVPPEAPSRPASRGSSIEVEPGVSRKPSLRSGRVQARANSEGNDNGNGGSDQRIVRPGEVRELLRQLRAEGDGDGDGRATRGGRHHG
jgi:hypothetical protein